MHINLHFSRHNGPYSIAFVWTFPRWTAAPQRIFAKSQPCPGGVPDIWSGPRDVEEGCDQRVALSGLVLEEWFVRCLERSQVPGGLVSSSLGDPGVMVCWPVNRTGGRETKRRLRL